MSILSWHQTPKSLNWNFKIIYILLFSPQAKTFAKALGMDFTDEQTCWRIMRNAEQFGREVSDQVIFQFAFCNFFWSI